MGNPRNWTTQHNAVNDRLRAFLKQKGCTTRAKREQAKARALSMPNRLEPIRRAQS